MFTWKDRRFIKPVYTKKQAVLRVFLNNMVSTAQWELPTPCFSTLFSIFVSKYMYQAVFLFHAVCSQWTCFSISTFSLDTNFVYWADTALFTLNRIKRDHTERQVLLTATNSRIEGIAVDWIAGNIYWTDQRNDMIEVSRTNGSFHYVLSSQGHDKPRAIVVHPIKGSVKFKL